MLEHGDPIVGVVFDPLRGELFTASKGDGAFLNDRRMRVGKREGLHGALLATGFPFRQRAHLEAQIGMTRALLREAEDIRRTGSAALDIAYVAAGRLDGFYEIGLKPWDMAAGCLLVREAGGKHCDFVGRDGMPAERQPARRQHQGRRCDGQGNCAGADAGAGALIFGFLSFRRRQGEGPVRHGSSSFREAGIHV